jgi:cystathionine beta-lyase
MDPLCPNARARKGLLGRYPDKIRFKVPEGTYLAWMDCSGLGLNNRALRRFFVQKAGLGLSAGISFGKEGSQFMRLNFAVAKPVMDEALQRLERALGE